jgi:hypothetical protein
MRGEIPSLPNTRSWRGVQFKKAQGELYFSSSSAVVVVVVVVVVV